MSGFAKTLAAPTAEDVGIRSKNRIKLEKKLKPRVEHSAENTSNQGGLGPESGPGFYTFVGPLGCVIAASAPGSVYPSAQDGLNVVANEKA